MACSRPRSRSRHRRDETGAHKRAFNHDSALIRVLGIAGNTLYGPKPTRLDMLVSDLRSEIRDVIFPPSRDDMFTENAQHALLSSGRLNLFLGKTQLHGDQRLSDVVCACLEDQKFVCKDKSIDISVVVLPPSHEVVTWGYAFNGGDSASVADRLSSGITSIYGNSDTFGGAFAALSESGGVVAWGTPSYGGTIPLELEHALKSDVIYLATTDSAFAALKRDGSVVSWGRDRCGGDDSSVRNFLTGGVRSVVSTRTAFAALKYSGQVITWGDAQGGGDSFKCAQELRQDVRFICAGDHAFAALKTTGRVVAWGEETAGGDVHYPYIRQNENDEVANDLSDHVIALHSNACAFAALKEHGHVVTWGAPSHGGDSSLVSHRLKEGIASIISGKVGFVAITQTGDVVCWGQESLMTYFRHVSSRLQAGVRAVSCLGYGFCAELVDGSMVLWGEGLTDSPTLVLAKDVLDVEDLEDEDEEEDTERMRRDAVQVCRNGFAAAVLLRDGSVRAFGRANRGGDASAVADKLRNSVRHLFCNNWAFAALRELE